MIGIITKECAELIEKRQGNTSSWGKYLSNTKLPIVIITNITGIYYVCKLPKDSNKYFISSYVFNLEHNSVSLISVKTLLALTDY